jgi:hypothetical protein
LYINPTWIATSVKQQHRCPDASKSDRALELGARSGTYAICEPRSGMMNRVDAGASERGVADQDRYVAVALVPANELSAIASVAKGKLTRSVLAKQSERHRSSTMWLEDERAPSSRLALVAPQDRPSTLISKYSF